jgi:hypothetical protein
VRAGAIDYHLESIAAGMGKTSAEVVSGFLQRTRFLTPGEQAELLGAFLESAPASGGGAARRPQGGGQPSRAPSGGQTPPRQSGGQTPQRQSSGQTPQRQSSGQTPQRQSGGQTPQRQSGGQTPQRQSGGQAPQRAAGGDFFSSFGRVASGFQQGLSYFTQGAQAISSIASLFGGSTAQDVSRVAGQLAQGGSQVGSMLQGLQGGAAPSLPGAPAGGAPGAPSNSAAAGGQFNATALLQMLMSNPQIQQALRTAPVLGQGAQTEVELALPAESGSTTVSIPLRHIVNTVAELASRSAAELSVGAPGLRSQSYATEDAGFADPAHVLQYLRISSEAERFDEATMDEWAEWANEADFY